jgi:hypothetical protein
VRVARRVVVDVAVQNAGVITAVFTRTWAASTADSRTSRNLQQGTGA